MCDTKCHRNKTFCDKNIVTFVCARSVFYQHSRFHAVIIFICFSEGKHFQLQTFLISWCLLLFKQLMMTILHPPKRKKMFILILIPRWKIWAFAATFRHTNLYREKNIVKCVWFPPNSVWNLSIRKFAFVMVFRLFSAIRTIWFILHLDYMQSQQISMAHNRSDTVHWDTNVNEKDF